MKYFTKLAADEKIARMSYETVYLRLELLEVERRHRSIESDGIRVFPRRRYGFKIFRYAGETGPSVRAYWGHWKSRRRFLWGHAVTPSWEGELLAEEIIKAPPQPWRDLSEAREIGEE